MLTGVKCQTDWVKIVKLPSLECQLDITNLSALPVTSD